ncbi:hypothetical protein [Tepidimicrobium xylanilyticum]|nr:hypothetical protein [Tepidimicrobium xylanilyticum]GMG95292.1 hypothetical protein EN5CB1_01180 [Tepidimicrobium xylanilyticum]
MARYGQVCPIIYGEGTINLFGEEAKKLGCAKVWKFRFSPDC